tara:strand:- start:700 stop:1305 length:606 start_codon:yes stop_codon:yes gene_type:complete
MLNMDNFLKEVDYALEVLDSQSNSSSEDEVLSTDEKKQSQRVMRVNHMGEVCAQALYRGQAFTTDETSTKELILTMCNEERDHLEMCGDRIGELSGKTSYFNILWYASSFMLGAYVGRLSKEKSLGFIYETEEQVEKHLDEYKDKLPKNDKKSRNILLEIKKDETKHKDTAKELGSTNLSSQTRNFMSLSSRVMKKLSFYF